MYTESQSTQDMLSYTLLHHICIVCAALLISTHSLNWMREMGGKWLKEARAPAESLRCLDS
jgi:hypothetical protein